jgi:death-on-curing protein
MRYLSPRDLLVIHQSLLLEFGGMPGITEAGFGRLETAAAVPQQSMFGADLYPTLADKGAALLHAIIRNHPFSDGNKRVAVVALVVLLQLNGAALEASNDEIYDLAIATSEGRTSREDLAAWVAARLVEPAHP